jgi:hypothetical protein
VIKKLPGLALKSCQHSHQETVFKLETTQLNQIDSKYYRNQTSDMNLLKVYRHNVSTFKSQPLREISGAFGDLGTFIPIFIALASNGQISASATLIFSGLANIITGMLFGIPLPVQPMKAIAAVAIQQKVSNGEIAVAGLFVAGVVFIFSVTGLLDWFTKSIPSPIVKGIQVGAGLSLMSTLKIPLGIQIAYLVGGLILPLPIIILISFILASLSFEIWKPEAILPAANEIVPGVFIGLGQLPLTTLNSVLAVVVLAQDLFEESPTAGQIGISIGIMNLGIFFRSMPFCHGSGGLAAQYRFGARSGSSIIILGSIKLILGLFASTTVLAWCKAFTESVPAVLGLLIFLAGLELTKMGESLNKDTDDQESMERWIIMFTTVGSILATKNDGIGFLVGLGVHFGYKIRKWYNRIRLESDVEE